MHGPLNVKNEWQCYKCNKYQKCCHGTAIMCSYCTVPPNVTDKCAFCHQQQQNIPRPSCKIHDIFIRLNQIWIFTTDSSVGPQYQTSRKFVWCKPSWYIHRDRRIDITKRTGAIHEDWVPKNNKKLHNNNATHLVMLGRLNTGTKFYSAPQAISKASQCKGRWKQTHALKKEQLYYTVRKIKMLHLLHLFIYLFMFYFMPLQGTRNI